MRRDGLSLTVVQADSRIRPAEQPKLLVRVVAILRTFCRVPI